VCHLTGKRFDPFILPSLVLAILALAVATFRPYGGFRDVKFTASGRDILAIVDVSRSMLAEDVKPTRLDSAKRKLYDLTEILKDRFPGDRLGVILFAGDAFLYLPLTTDYGAARQFIREISTNLITNPGSDIVGAFKVARDAIVGAKARIPAIVLLSDGEDLVFKEDKAKLVLQELKDVPVFTIGIGSSEGTPLPEYGGGFIRNIKGEIVVSKLDENSLRQLASITGGQFTRYSIADDDLKPLLASHKSGEAIDGSFRVYDEYGSYFVALALGALLVLAARRREIAFCLLITAAGTAYADDYGEAKRAFNDGDYAKAAENFGRIATPDSAWKVKQGHAASLYRLGKFDEASKVFADSKAQSQEEVFTSKFNQGNADFQAGQYQQAITAYEEALKINSNDEKAKFNLALAKKRLEEQQKQEQQNKQNQEQNKDQKHQSGDKQQNQPQDSSSSSGSEPGASSSSSSGQNSDGSSSSSGSGEETSQDSEGSSSSTSGQEANQNEAETTSESGSSSSSGINEETQRWLDSLPDDRLILQHRTGHAPRGAQTW
jgi:Ca-activated chloride channel family protein